MKDYTLRHTEEREGFTIKLYTTWEEAHPDWDFESEEAKQQLLEDINNGNLEWFIAKVTAEKMGIELATDYIGGCCYESVGEFIRPGDYYTQMIETVISKAKRTLISLCD